MVILTTGRISTYINIFGTMQLNDWRRMMVLLTLSKDDTKEAKKKDELYTNV